MEFLFPTTIVYTCKVHNAGYELEGQRKVIKPRYKSHIVDKPFTYEAVNDFIALGSPFNNEHIDEQRIRFSNKWGTLYSFRNHHEARGENGATFDKLLWNFQKDIEARKSSDFPQFNMHIAFSWSRTKEGRLIAIVQAPSLMHAIQTAYHLSPGHNANTRECLSESCHNYFEAKPTSKKYCSPSCKARSNMRIVREKKKHVLSIKQ